MTTLERSQLKKNKVDHLNLIKAEQTFYHCHQREALNDPGGTFSIIMDGATDVILPFLIPVHLPGKICIFTNLESMAYNNSLYTCIRDSLAVVPTLPFLCLTNILHCI
jgi:hypothetical protein